MHRSRSLLALACLAALAALSLGRAQQAVPKAPTAAEALDQQLLALAKKDSQIMANLTYLSDIIGPRLTGSAALKKANEWVAETMRSYGLTNVHLEPWTIPSGWERGTATARIVEPDNGRSLTVASMGWSPGTNGKVTGDVVVIQAKNSQELAAYKGKLKNAIVLRGQPANVRPINDRSTPGPGGNPFGSPMGRRGDGNFREMMAFYRELAEFMRTEGVACLLQDAGKPQGLLTMTGSWRGRDRASAGDPIPSLFVAHEHYALLYRLATRPAPARTRMEVEITNKFIPGPIAVYNTIGEIKGSEKPDEFVVVGAHLDSWDLAQGTTDNGTGTVVMLEAARILAHCGTAPKRTIRFISFTGEEQGLHGSQAYVTQHKDEMARTSMCLVHDTGTGKVTGIGLQGRPVLKPIMERELASLKAIGVTDFNIRSMGGSDHSSFEQAGVPGFAVQQDMSEYRFTHHSQSDTLDKAHEEDLIQGAQVMAVAAMHVANLNELLPRDKPATAFGGGRRGGIPEKLWVYLGTNTGKGSKGVYRSELDVATGKLTTPTLAGETVNPTFVALHPSGRYLYAVNAVNELGGQKTGAISAFAIDPKTGDLKFLNQQPSGGAGPCHVIVDRQGKHVLAANSGGGSACVFAVADDGRLGERTAFVQHKGSGANPQRQEGPHAHSINLDRANRFAFVADLGLDKVFVYRYDADKGTLTPNQPDSVAVEGGSGPRHFAFHPDGKYAYVINELASTVTAFTYDAEKGVLERTQTISTLPEGWKGTNYCAEVQVHPSGEFLYGSNRGHDSIAVFKIDPKTGKLTAAGHQGQRIKTPRNFAIDPTGMYALVANQDGNSVLVFKIDAKTGALTPTDTVVEAPTPICIKMMPPPR